jgi:hypothetical protein
MSLAEHPHPFRWTQRAYFTDFIEQQLGTSTYSLDEEKVKNLMLQVGTTIPGVDSSERVRIFPCCMPGSKGPHLHNLHGHEKPSKIALALTGLPDIKLMGLDSYAHPHDMLEGYKTRLAFKPRSLKHLLLVSGPLQSSQKHANKSDLKMAPLWSTVTGARGCWGFLGGSAPSGPPPIPIQRQSILHLEDELPPAKYRTYMHQARVHYDKVASYVHATGIADMRINKNWFLTPHGMLPITEDDLLRAVPTAWSISTSRPIAALEDTNAAVEMAPRQV